MSGRPWQGREPSLTPQQAERLRSIGEQRQSLPSNRQLAREFGISPATVNSYLRGRLPKRYAGG